MRERGSLLQEEAYGTAEESDIPRLCAEMEDEPSSPSSLAASKNLAPCPRRDPSVDGDEPAILAIALC